MLKRQPKEEIIKNQKGFHVYRRKTFYLENMQLELHWRAGSHNESKSESGFHVTLLGLFLGRGADMHMRCTKLGPAVVCHSEVNNQ